VQAATAQEAFEELALSAVRAALIHRNGDDTVSDGLVLTGGCALNIKVSATGSAGARSQPWPSRTDEMSVARASFACVGWQVNQLLAERYGAQRVYVPSAPNDSGLGIGMIWALHPPPHTPDGRQDLSRLGPPIWDAEHLHSMIAERLPLNADARAVAHALAQGSIVGVVRGRTEARPGRKHDALQPPMSHRRRYRRCAGGTTCIRSSLPARRARKAPRDWYAHFRRELRVGWVSRVSLLCAGEGLKPRLNRLKARQWYGSVGLDNAPKPSDGVSNIHPSLRRCVQVQASRADRLARRHAAFLRNLACVAVYELCSETQRSLFE
jgi:hypothetical protein